MFGELPGWLFRLTVLDTYLPSEVYIHDTFMIDGWRSSRRMRGSRMRSAWRSLEPRCFVAMVPPFDSLRRDTPFCFCRPRMAAHSRRWLAVLLLVEVGDRLG